MIKDGRFLDNSELSASVIITFSRINILLVPIHKLFLLTSQTGYRNNWSNQNSTDCLFIVCCVLFLLSCSAPGLQTGKFSLPFLKSVSHSCATSSGHRPKRKQHYLYCRKFKKERAEKETSDCDLVQQQFTGSFPRSRWYRFSKQNV